MERKAIIGTLDVGAVFHYYGERRAVGPYVIVGQPGSASIAKRNGRQTTFPLGTEVYVDLGPVTSDDAYMFDKQELWDLMALKRNGFHIATISRQRNSEF